MPIKRISNRSRRVFGSEAVRCEHCGRKFKKNRPWQRYCIDRCAWEARNQRRAERVAKALELLKQKEGK